jgi:ABC-2 type transport system ATP-binding protein
MTVTYSESAVRSRLLTALLLLALSAVALPGVAAADEVCDAYPCDVMVTSFDGVEIAVTIHKPAGASADTPVPLLLEGHGWGGSRQSGAGAFAAIRDRDYGVLSIDQRGHGDSGGEANVFDPAIEGRDLLAVMDLATSLPWVARDTDEAGRPIPDDPRLGAIGLSYGGGFQYAAALIETALTGGTRLDALAPEITWHNLNDALAPNGVPRSTWLTGLFGLSAAGANRPAPYISEAFVYGAATGRYPDGRDALPGLGAVLPAPDLFNEFALHSPHGYLTRHAEIAERLGVADPGPVQLDLPVFMGQAANDNVFNLNQAWHNFHDTLTDEARAQSTLLSYDFGHSLPSASPLGDFSQLQAFNGGCATPGIFGAAGSYGAPGGGGFGGYGGAAPSFESLALDFFDAVFDEDPTTSPQVLGGAYALSAYEANGGPQGPAPAECLVFDAPAQMVTTAPLQVDPTGEVGPATGTVTVAGAPIHLPLDGTSGVTLAGVPVLRADLYGLGLDQRIFVGLSRGHSPASAQLIANNLLPLAFDGPLEDGSRRIEMELPGAAAIMGPGEQLYLTITPYSEQFYGHASRTPGAVGLAHIEVDLPLDPAA